MTILRLQEIGEFSKITFLNFSHFLITFFCIPDKPTILRNLVTAKNAAELGSSLELRCIAEGDGNISFVWSYNSTVIIQGLDIGRYDIRSAQTGELQWCSVLTIKRVKTEDFGEYTCVARNHLGYDFIKFSVLKKGKLPRNT